jgi:GNAT superfamily N-acetyltransferase
MDAMELTVCVTDEEYEAWRTVRIAVEPGSRTLSVEELRSRDASERLLLLAHDAGELVGCGLADRAETADSGAVIPRVLPQHRRRGAGSMLLHALARHCETLGVPRVVAGVDDEGSLAFARRFGFAEVDREIQQTRAVGAEPEPGAAPAAIEVIDASGRTDLWAGCFETFGKEVLADFALYTPLDISAEQWSADWCGDPQWLALVDGEVVGCAGLIVDPDRPDRAENSLTAVSRAWRGRGLAAHLKRLTLHWAGGHGIEEIYTWTQAGNTPMLRLNEHLGYTTSQTSISLARDLPLTGSP